MARYPKSADRCPVSFRLHMADLETLDAIMRELARRGDPDHNRTKALRWAIRELDARIGLGRNETRDPTAYWTLPGPMTPPPG